MQLTTENRKRLWFAYFATLLCWSCSSYFLIATWASEGTLFARSLDGQPRVLDYLLFYEDEYLAIHAKSQNINIYDPEVQAAGIAKLMAPVVPTTKFYSHYPPPLFVLSIPFGFLPMLWSYVSWNLAGTIALMLSILPFAYKRFGKTFPLLFIALAVLTCFPVWNCLELGQSSLFLVGGIALFFALAKRQKYFLAGLSTFFLMIKVQYLPVIVLIGLVLGRVKFAGGAILAGLLTVAASVLTLGWNNCMEWPKIVLHGETSAINRLLIAPDMMQNIRGILNQITGDDSSTVRLISAGLCIVTIFLIGFLWTSPYKRLQSVTKYAFEAMSAISMMIMLLFSVHTHAHDYCVFVCSCVWLYVALLDMQDTTGVTSGAATSTEATSSAATSSAATSSAVTSSAATSNAVTPSMKYLRILLIGFPIFGWILFVAEPIIQHVFKLQPLAVYLAVVLALAVRIWLVPLRARSQDGSGPVEA